MFSGRANRVRILQRLIQKKDAVLARSDTPPAVADRSGMVSCEIRHSKSKERVHSHSREHHTRHGTITLFCGIARSGCILLAHVQSGRMKRGGFGYSILDSRRSFQTILLLILASFGFFLKQCALCAW